jgi:SAM-dependent methyltransferase
LDPEEYELIYRVEDRHWWYLGMLAISRALLDRSYRSFHNLRILDAGCGTGAAMTGWLAGYGTVTGLDLSPLALGFCRLRKAGSLVRGTVTQLPFESLSFDLITSFDVLYESSVTDDGHALMEFSRLLVPGGRLLVRLPAYDWLRGRHDAVVHTARRYSLPQVAGLFHQSGLTLELLSYANTFLFPIALLKRLWERIWLSGRPRSDLSYPLGPLNALFRSILMLEVPFITHSGLPFGLSLVAVGQKP